MYCHARIELKAKRAKEPKKVAIELDLSREDLLNKIAAPYSSSRRFILGGVPINPDEVEEVLFSETESNSAAIMASLRVRNLSRNIVSTVNSHSVVRAGTNITRSVLEDAEKITIRDTVNEDPASVQSQRSNRVFIVHGHDQMAVEQTENLVRRFGLIPIILRDAPNAGNTVIEKFEAHSEVGFAIILLTPDDVGGISKLHLAPRARQNAIWEWGYLVAKLGRRYVVCLYKDGVEIPSDLHGLLTIKIGEQVRDKTEEIRREFIAAGYRLK